VRERGMRQSGAVWAMTLISGARGDGEKVNEVLANYGLFRITYVGQSGLLERPFVVNFHAKDELL
jgi:hypothetical protein